MAVQKIALDLSKSPVSPETVIITENDFNRPEVDIAILDHGEPADIGSYTQMLEIRKGDKRVSAYSTSRLNNVVRFQFSKYMRNPDTGLYDVALGAGETDIAYVLLKRGDVRMSTARFHLVILEKAGQ